MATASSEIRRRRLRLKRIVVSEKNYVALKRLGHAGDSFNDVITKLLRLQKNHQQKKQQHQERERMIIVALTDFILRAFQNS
jgi:predicted CopG family antitoxin